MNIISDIDVAKLMQHLNIIQAASLIVGVSPATIYKNDDNQSQLPFMHNNYQTAEKFNDVLEAITHAVKFGSLEATIAYEPRALIQYNNFSNPSYLYQDDLSGDWFTTANIDINNTFIQRSKLKHWLLSHDVKPPSLFTDSENDNADYLNKEHDRYVPKLALCIRAWQSSQYLPDNVAVGLWLQDYIKDHAKEYDLSSSDTMVQNLATICNWNSKGGNKSTFPYLRDNIPNDYSQMPNKATASIKDDSFLPELIEFLEPKPEEKDNGDIPF